MWDGEGMTDITSHQELGEHIERLVQGYVASIHVVVRDAASRALTGSRTPAAVVGKAVPQSRSSGARQRRAPDEIAAVSEQLYQAVCERPGETMAVLARELGASPRELKRPMKRLKRSGRVRSVGERHHTRYFPIAEETTASA